MIRRSLGDETVAKVSRVLGDSIRWALAHRGQVIEALMEAESRQDVKLDHAMLDRYLGMYANEDTLDYGPRGRTAIEELFRLGHEAGLLPHRVRVEFAPF